ncbi:MAG: hypothetical protein ACI9B9_001260 [Halioglobus sp.]|jgi:hypothetical protein
MRCILHIGTEKTGSTAIQTFLYDNIDRLQRARVHVCQSVGESNNRLLPAAFMDEEKVDDLLRALKHKDLRARRRWRSKVLKNFEKEVAKARKKSDVFIVSCEHFHSRLLSLAEVSHLADFLRPLFNKIDIICYLRRQDQMAVSRYSQALRAGHVLGAPVPRADRIFQGHLPPYFDYESLLDRWSTAFGESSVQPSIYSPSHLLEGNVVLDFLQKADMGINAHDMPMVVHANSSLSLEAQTVLLGANKALDTVHKTDEHRQQYTRLVKYLDRNAQGVGLLPEKAQAWAFYQAFESANSAVANRWFSRDILFDEDFSGYLDVKPDINAQEVATLLTGFMLQEKS